MDHLVPGHNCLYLVPVPPPRQQAGCEMPLCLSASTPRRKRDFYGGTEILCGLEILTHHQQLPVSGSKKGKKGNQINHRSLGMEGVITRKSLVYSLTLYCIFFFN
ncbi:hypothetical protein GDO81_021197 [Engystomops pustulosus]|uniref:Uncharacterized protein n=1 Tax=Engystomops pustulosus TaxID=76066 RepID=A0AAV6Z7X5_ENGPU|nr:hypothetical protein GDO81_021197 [Engystomops pustulosus]